MSLLSWRLCRHSKGSKDLCDEVHVNVAEFFWGIHQPSNELPLKKWQHLRRFCYKLLFGLTNFNWSYFPSLKFSFLFLWIDVVRFYGLMLSVFLTSTFWLTFAFQFWNLLYNAALVVSCFLCSLLRFWLEIWYLNLYRHNTDQVWL